MVPWEFNQQNLDCGTLSNQVMQQIYPKAKKKSKGEMCRIRDMMEYQVKKWVWLNYNI
jgi:hypothetical protein